MAVIPDYEGYGVTSSDPHPYCSREITAKQMIDGAKAAVAWFEENVTKMPSGWKSVAVGYSQGGAVAASVLDNYHAHNQKGLDIIGAVCGDGPYDPLPTCQRNRQPEVGPRRNKVITKKPAVLFAGFLLSIR